MTTKIIMNGQTYDSIKDAVREFDCMSVQDREDTTAKALEILGFSGSDAYSMGLLAHDLVLAGFGSNWVEAAMDEMNADASECGDDTLGTRIVQENAKKTYVVVYSYTGTVRVQATDEQDAIERAAALPESDIDLVLDECVRPEAYEADDGEVE